MRNIKCADCEEYRNEWCKKMLDSPHPDMLRDCQYWHERKNMVEVIRCRDCKQFIDHRCVKANHYVSECENCMDVFGAERREE